jgi:hypothetical protein
LNNCTMPDDTFPKRPKLLIEDWLPAQALGVECMRERGSASALAPHTFLHVWWARRPLTAARAAVLASLLPAYFDREVFERLVGFGRPSRELVEIRARMDTGVRIEGGFGCKRAFTNVIQENDLKIAHSVMADMWGSTPTTIDPMAGGGSIPLEAARIGVNSLANEYNPVACIVLEATVDYPFRFGASLSEKSRKWGKLWEQNVAERLEAFFPKEPMAVVHAYIYAHTVPCPDTPGNPQTPICPDWSLSKVNGRIIVAEPTISLINRQWTVKIREVGKGAGQLRQSPSPTYSDGTGVSLFSGIRTCSFLREHRLMSRGYMSDNCLGQTPQASDPIDQDVGVWHDIFLDSCDIHQRASKRNIYGPVLFELKLAILKHAAVKSISITRSNPLHWTGTPVGDRWFNSLEDIKAEFTFGTFEQMIVIRRLDELPLEGYMQRIILDSPRQSFPEYDDVDIFSYVRVQVP